MPTPDPYFDTMFAFQRSAALKTAIELDLFTAIGDGARTGTAIASACGASERGIRILCDFMTVIGFLTKSGDTYGLTPETTFFLSKRSPFLKKTAPALQNDGRGVILEFVPNDDRVTPSMAARFSLAMLAGTPGGDAYTFRELRDMLTGAGFRNATAHALQGPETVIVATK